MRIKWTKEAVFAESKKFASLADFSIRGRMAYLIALKYGWLDDMPWISRKYVKRGTWNNKENVIQESKKYKSITEFREKASCAYNAAVANGWISEMEWLEKSDKKPKGYWNVIENVIEESRKYHTRVDFLMGSPSAYATAKRSGLFGKMPWLSATINKPFGYWKIKRNVFSEAKKFKYKSDFHRTASAAYNSARKNGWLEEMIWFKHKNIERAPKGSVHVVYVYIDEIHKFAYVGATNDIVRRDTEHRQRKDDPVYQHFERHHLTIPNYKIIIDGLTIDERQREERIWSLYYKDVLHYKMLNNVNLTGINIGSIGSLASKWTKSNIIKEALKYKSPTDFCRNASGAYDAAVRYKMLNIETFPWFYEKRKPTRWWNDKERVFEESRKYQTFDEFFNNSQGAWSSAQKHGWLKEFTWLKKSQASKGYWQDEKHVIEESKKYNSKTAFFHGCHAAYDYASIHNLWEKMPWIKMRQKERGYWTKEKVLEESKKYHCRTDFEKGSSTAYHKARINHWLDEMIWLKSQKGK